LQRLRDMGVVAQINLRVTQNRTMVGLAGWSAKWQESVLQTGLIGPAERLWSHGRPGAGYVVGSV
jgi:hypothetical protein